MSMNALPIYVSSPVEIHIWRGPTLVTSRFSTVQVVGTSNPSINQGPTVYIKQKQENKIKRVEICVSLS